MHITESCRLETRKSHQINATRHTNFSVAALQKYFLTLNFFSIFRFLKMASVATPHNLFPLSILEEICERTGRSRECCKVHYNTPPLPVSTPPTTPPADTTTANTTLPGPPRKGAPLPRTIEYSDDDNDFTLVRSDAFIGDWTTLVSVPRPHFRESLI